MVLTKLQNHTALATTDEHVQAIRATTAQLEDVYRDVEVFLNGLTEEAPPWDAWLARFVAALDQQKAALSKLSDTIW